MEHLSPLAPHTSHKASVFEGASPKLTFVMGLVVGVAAVSLVGFVLAGTYVLSGNSLRGVTGPTAVATPPPGATANPQQPAAPSKVSITIKPTDHVTGGANAPVTMVSYTDLECPYCKRFHPVVEQALKQYGNKLRVVYRNFPLSFHQNAQKEAEASECVAKLGGNDAYWSFVGKIFERTTSNGTGFALGDLAPLAKEVGVTQSRFQTCFDQGEMAAKVQSDLAEGSSYGVNGTPTSFINGTPVEGAVPFEQLKAAIDQALQAS